MKRFGLIVLFPLLTALSGQTFPRKVTLLPIAAERGRGILGKLPIAFDGPVISLQFSADGSELLSSSTDSIDRTPWPGGSPQTIWAPFGDDTFTGAIFSPDGKQFARADQGRHIHIHETSSGKILQTFEGRTSGSEVAWSPDRKKIAMGSGSDVLLHDLVHGKAMRRIAPGGEDVDSLDWSPDGNWLAVFTRNYKNNKGPAFLIHLSNEATKPIRLPGDHDIIFSFSPDSARLAVNGHENDMGFLCLWDIGNQKEIVRIQSWDYNKMKHSPDGRLLVAGGLNELRILDARNLTDFTRREADSIHHHIYGLAFSPDGSLLAYGVENRIRVRDTRTWDEINPDDTLRSSVNALAFSADGKHLVTGGWNGDVVMWDWQKKTPVWKQLAPSDQWPIDAVSIDPTSRWIGVVQSSRARLIQYATGERHRTLDTGDIRVGGEAAPLFTRDGESAYVTNDAEEILELECANGSLRRRRASAGKYAIFDSLAFNSRKPELIYWSTETEAAGRLDLMSHEVLDVFENRYSKQGIDIIPTRNHEFLAYGDNIHNLPSLRLMMFPQNNDILPSVRHPSELLYFFARGRTVSVCDLMSQSVITQFDAGPGEIDTLAISPDGLTLVAGTTGALTFFSLEGEPIDAETALDTLWNLMGSENHWMAYQAAWAMARQPDYIAFLEKQLPPAEEPSATLIAAIKKQMADSSHEVRQTAARQWLDLGFDLDKEILGTLGDGGLKARWPRTLRSDRMFPSAGLGNMARPVPPLTPLSAHRQAMRAVMLLKSDHGDAASRLLARLAKGYAKAPVTIACKRALP